MQITEPVTLIVDYLLALSAFYFAFLLYQQHGYHHRWFISSYLALALSAFSGGTVLGLVQFFPDFITFILWKLTLYALGFSSMLFVQGFIEFNDYPHPYHFGLKFLIYAKLAVFIVVTSLSDSFVPVVIDYGITLGAVGLLVIFMAESNTIKRKFVHLAITLTALVGIVWMTEFGFQSFLSHNDIAHLLLIPTTYLFYLAIRQ